MQKLRKTLPYYIAERSRDNFPELFENNSITLQWLNKLCRGISLYTPRDFKARVERDFKHSKVSGKKGN
jgi:hypothetical protein